MKKKVVLLGFDGLDFRVIDPLIDQGYLPHFSKLKESGSWGSLKSTLPPTSPAAWNSMITGLMPAKHGVFDIFKFSWKERRARLLTRRRNGKAVWERLSEEGKQVIVINVPCTYPPDVVNGIMISGFMAPYSLSKAVYPGKFHKKLNQVVPEYQIEAEWQENDPNSNHFALRAIEQNTKCKMRLLKYCLEEERWDFLFFVFEGPDRLQHRLWPEIISGEPDLRSYYQLLDSIIGLVREYLPEDGALMVVSDHGFMPIEGFTFVNEVLLKHNLLKIRKIPFLTNLILKKYVISSLKRLPIYGLRSALGSRLDTAIKNRIRGPMLLRILDWKHSKLVAFTNTGAIYVTSGREGDDLNKMKKPLKDLLEVDKVYTRKEAFGQGPYLKDGPGFVVTDSSHELRQEITRIERPSEKRCATHSQHGIFFASGKGIKESHLIKNASICDITPTILYSMGVPISKELDGVILDDIFKT